MSVDRPALSSRQREVLCLLSHGKTAEEIGADLGISPRTVRVHIDALKRKLGARRSRELPAAFRSLTGCDPMLLLDR